MSTTLDRCSQHLALYPFSPRSCSIPLADHLHLWVSLLFSHSPRLGVWPPLHFRDLSSVPSLQTVDGSKVTSLACFIFPSPSLSSTLEFDGQPWSRIVFSLRAPLLGRLLLGAPLPVPSSLVFLPLNTRWSVLWLVRCSKVPVGGSFSGSRLDSPVSTSDSPLVGLRPFLLPMFHPKLPFFVGIAVLADASTAYANVSPYLYVTTQLALCRLMRFVFVTVSYPCQS